MRLKEEILRTKLIIQIFILALLTGSLILTVSAQQNVSFVSLLATPEKYDGKKVRVSGVLHFQFEDSALYFHKDDADYLHLANGIWISYAEKRVLDPRCKKDFVAFGSKADYFDGRYVSVEGTFNMKQRGHLSAFAGTIEEVTLVFEERRWFDGSRKVALMDGDGRILNDCK